jgi:hypothetical protein
MIVQCEVISVTGRNWQSTTLPEIPLLVQGKVSRDEVIFVVSEVIKTLTRRRRRRKLRLRERCDSFQQTVSR